MTQEDLQEKVNLLIDDWCVDDREDISTVDLAERIMEIVWPLVVAKPGGQCPSGMCNGGVGCVHKAGI